jgi:hypothetical protein
MALLVLFTVHILDTAAHFHLQVCMKYSWKSALCDFEGHTGGVLARGFFMRYTSPVLA